MSRKDNLIWIDLEMTGLDPDNDYIIEIATIVTDANLNILAEGPSLVIHQPEAVMKSMNEWCVKQHGQSGLTQRVGESIITEREAEQQTIEFLAKYVDKGASPICGNSIGQDRRFLNRYMTELESYFHYRNLDVSTIKELARRWKPELLHNFTKKGSHLAMDDIRDSIAELQHYRATFFKE